MGSLSFGEIITIIIVILIIFGPNRLPEFSRKVGEFVAKARNATREFTETMQSELGEDTIPIRDIVDDLDGIKRDLGSAASAITGGPTPVPPKNVEPHPNDPDGNAIEMPGLDVRADHDDEEFDR
ncbi:MAG: twin-arginine translocase TatA/TatE family subunit [Acidimicrobiia bacterium]|nr:twin-arginine translocase TatA/TatE family subunit [Acidimicrobiia bacterium]